MKTKFLSVLMLLLAINMQSQDDNKKESNTGLKGGYNLAAVSFDGDGETGQRHSFHIGFYSESFLNDNVSLQNHGLPVVE